MSIETRYDHVVRDTAGVPRITGSTIKVVELVLDHLAYGWSPEELHFQHPSLSMAEIHSALAFYWDNKEELDRDIDARRKSAESIRAELPMNPHVQRLLGRG